MPHKDLRFKLQRPKGVDLVLIRWLIAGKYLEETVPVGQARRRRTELEGQGAVIYWSERLLISS